jgi:hypothetical protein
MSSAIPDVQTWIESQIVPISWHENVPAYWKEILVHANAESCLPQDVSVAWYRYLWRWERVRVPEQSELASVRFLAPSDWIKAIRYIERSWRDWPIRVSGDAINLYGELIGALLNAEIRRMTEKLDCVDNIRVARTDDKKQLRLYREQQKAGCCGRHDQTVTIDGRSYLIGCNYGH